MARIRSFSIQKPRGCSKLILKEQRLNQIHFAQMELALSKSTKGQYTVQVQEAKYLYTLQPIKDGTKQSQKVLINKCITTNIIAHIQNVNKNQLNKMLYSGKETDSTALNTSSHYNKLLQKSISKSPPKKRSPNTKSKETSEFVLDCCNATRSKIPEYSDTEDTYLKQFFGRPAFKKLIQRSSMMPNRKSHKRPRNYAVNNTEDGKLPEITKKPPDNLQKSTKDILLPKQLMKIYLSSKAAAEIIERRKKHAQKGGAKSMSGEGLKQVIEKCKEKIKKLDVPIKYKAQCGKLYEKSSQQYY
eukprot:TRINITY_DN88976_c0_g1_i1.p2 TRINITY_DN88976_c0_g1~~TRINITY_DN88976_c0_g1_i1.p2  ORF type:complete len:301 (+),score=19.23 TRINITY_DN88976_c0_g1_i1:791-1693(+)